MYQITKIDFPYTLNRVKKAGGKFDAATKTWTLSAGAALACDDLISAGYMVPAETAAPSLVTRRNDPATTWRGNASMEAADSIF